MKRLNIQTELTFYLNCDECDNAHYVKYWNYIHKDKKAVIESAKRDGWKVNIKNQTCLCPDCKNKSNETAPTNP